MSNYLAVATATAVLQRILQAATQTDVDGVRVTTVPPRQIGNGTPETGINIFLYHVTRNPALSKADSTGLRARGTPVKRQVALDLYYIMSFYGNDAELEPQRLLGSVARTLHDCPTLTSSVIQEAITDPSFRFLTESDLSTQLQQITIQSVDLSLDDLSKVWSTFFQAPYLLSLIYKVTVITIDGEESVRRSLPVRDRRMSGVVPFPQQPVVEQVFAITGKFDPILANSTLQVYGRQLQSSQTSIRIGGFEVTPAELSDIRLTLPLPELPVDCLRAGLQGLQVIHRLPAGMPTDNLYRTVESNVVPFVLRPSIKQVNLSNQVGRGEDLRSATLTIQVDVLVGFKQRVVLSLNEWSIENPVGYQFEAVTRSTDSDLVVIPLQGVKAGEYLLRLQIDGAESLLSIDTDPNSPTFNWYIGPKITLT